MIVLLTNEFPQYAGGVATYCYELARAMTAQGYPVTTLAAHKHPDDFAFDQMQTMSIYRIPETRQAVLRHLNRYWSLLNRVRTCRPTLLWASDWRTGLAVLPVARQLNIPYVVTAYGTELKIAAQSKYRHRLALAVFNNAQVVMSISRYTRQLLIDLGVAADKIKVTPLGIDPSQYAPDLTGVEKIVQHHAFRDKKVILTLARLTRAKGKML